MKIMGVKIYIVLYAFVFHYSVTANVFQQFVQDSTFKSKTCQPTELYQSTTQNSVMRCAHECSMDDICKSFFYSDETNICEECEAIYNASSYAAESTTTSSYFSKLENSYTGTTTLPPPPPPTTTTAAAPPPTTTTESPFPEFLSFGCYPTVTGQNNWVNVTDNSISKCGELCSDYPGFCLENESCLCHEEQSFSSATNSFPVTGCDTPCPGKTSDNCGSSVLSVAYYVIFFDPQFGQ